MPSSFQAAITEGNTIRLQCQITVDGVSIANLGEEKKLCNAVTLKFRAITFERLRNNNMVPIQIYVRLDSIDKNPHTVIITSEVLKLNRYFRVGAQGEQEDWRLLSKKCFAITSALCFDMEVGLADDDKERATDPLVFSLYEDEETTDVELVGADGKELRAHGNVLAKASPFLRAAFYGGLKEAHEKRLVVPDADQAALKLLKQFAYTGAIEAEPTALATLLPIAHRFQMPDLVRACAGILAESLPVDELTSMLSLDLQQTGTLLLMEMVNRFGPEKIIEEMKKNAAKATEPKNKKMRI